MNTFVETFLIWLVLGVLTLGLLSACLARISAGSSRQALSHALFLGCLPMVAGATIVSFGVGPGCWLASALTLTVMVLAATADTRRSRGAAIF